MVSTETGSGHLAGMADEMLIVAVTGLMMVLGIIILLVVTSSSVKTTMGLMSGILATGIADGTSIMNAAFAQANGIFATTEANATQTVGDITTALSNGVQSVFNVVTAVGGAVLNAVNEGFAALTDVLSEVGSDATNAFETILTPVTFIIRIVGDLILSTLKGLGYFFEPLGFIATGIADIKNIVKDIGGFVSGIGSLF